MIAMLALMTQAPVQAQSADSKEPIDMMILIDNSCSMFPANKILAGCDAYGADPNFLRIVGADLFIARLGFGEANEADYRLGVIGIGDQPSMVSPLASLNGNRDLLASKIANPLPQPATRIVPALQNAYDALQNSAQATPPRLPAIVMITDGIPWPRQGQSNDDIQKLVSAHANIPLFVMLLKNPNLNSPDFDEYIKFWQSLQGKIPYLFTYTITDASQIQDTYNQILGELQNTIPAKGEQLGKNGQSEFSVGNYVNEVIITSIRKSGSSTAKITITDPTGKPVNATDPGVTYFRGKDNPVEIYTITGPRLAGLPETGAWSVTSSDAVTLMVDRMGSYQFKFTNPAVKSAGLGNIYQATDTQFSGNGMSVQFQLQDDASNPILDPQPIQISITNPAGQTLALPVSTMKPDEKGDYQFQPDFSVLFPSLQNPAGQYSLDLKAGLSDPANKDSSPIASATLIMDVARAPSISSITPLPVYCRAGENEQMQVALQADDPTLLGNLAVRVGQADKMLSLTPDGTGKYTGDLTPLCQSIIARAACDSLSPSTLKVQVFGTGNLSLPEISRQVDVNVVSPACTQTPHPTLTPAPTPGPTPVPDSDHDGVNDLVDRCPHTWGLAADGGCIPWSPLLGGGGVFIALGMVRLWVWPLVKTRYISPAPKAYLAACREGVKMFEPVAIDAVSWKRRSSRLVIGGRSRRSDIAVKGLKPVEYYIEWKGGQVFMREPGDQEPFAYFDDTPRTIRTSDPKITLRIGLNPDQLSCA